MSKKEELYKLFKLYKEGSYDIDSFCDEFGRILYFESGAINELSDYEKEHFENLAKVTERYSPFVEDRKNISWYCDEKEVKDAIEVAYCKLFSI